MDVRPDRAQRRSPAGVRRIVTQLGQQHQPMRSVWRHLTLQQSPFRYSIAQNVWASFTCLPATNAGLVMVTLDGRPYAIGGTNGVDYFSTTYAHNGAAWLARAPMPMARMSVAAVTLSNTVVLVCGGHDASVVYALCHEYSSTLDVWMPVLPLTQTRTQATMVKYDGDSAV